MGKTVAMIFSTSLSWNLTRRWRKNWNWRGQTWNLRWKGWKLSRWNTKQKQKKWKWWAKWTMHETVIRSYIIPNNINVFVLSELLSICNNFFLTITAWLLKYCCLSLKSHGAHAGGRVNQCKWVACVHCIAKHSQPESPAGAKISLILHPPVLLDSKLPSVATAG